MDYRVPKEELEKRMGMFKEIMDQKDPNWKCVMIVTKIPQYYFTGTMQDGVLLIFKEENPMFFVRMSYLRAKKESNFDYIYPIRSFRDINGKIGTLPEIVYTETEKLSLAYVGRFKKYFNSFSFESCDMEIAKVREVKTEYELKCIRKSGEIHKKVLEELVPNYLEEGMTEMELATKTYSLLISEGHHGVSRFGMYDTEMVLGQMGFSENSMHPSYFNGPGGHEGLYPAVPLFGSRERELRKGDLVFLDIACGYMGYHTDKTMTYMFKESLPNEAIESHYKCVEIQNKIKEMLRPGEIPENIYQKIMGELDSGFLKGFMGIEPVRFLGHGVGLFIDETPVIANKFKEPLRENMTIALEPKRAIEGIGTVGIENTFLVTKNGGECLTGEHKGLMLV